MVDQFLVHSLSVDLKAISGWHTAVVCLAKAKVCSFYFKANLSLVNWPAITIAIFDYDGRLRAAYYYFYVYPWLFKDGNL